MKEMKEEKYVEGGGDFFNFPDQAEAFKMAACKIIIGII